MINTKIPILIPIHNYEDFFFFFFIQKKKKMLIKKKKKKKKTPSFAFKRCLIKKINNNIYLYIL